MVSPATRALRVGPAGAIGWAAGGQVGGAFGRFWRWRQLATSGSLEADEGFTIPHAAERVGSVPRGGIATGRRQERARTGRSASTGQDEMALEGEQATTHGAKAPGQRAVRHFRRVFGAPVSLLGAADAVCDSVSSPAFLSIRRSRRNLHEPRARNGDFPVGQARRLENRRYDAGRVHGADTRPKLEADTLHE